VPVQEGVREFLFHVWADVLAMTAVKYSVHGEETKSMKRAAADLIWSASAKVSREERAEVIRRLPLLLKTLREGMTNVGMPAERQDEHIHTLNSSLAAAFTAKSAAIPHERLEELMMRLDTLEEMLPDADDVQIDESMVLDLSGHESSELEVVAEGGSMPTPAMIAWARELQVGSWYMLDYRGRNEVVQLAWQGMRRQLSLFVAMQGRGEEALAIVASALEYYRDEAKNGAATTWFLHEYAYALTVSAIARTDMPAERAKRTAELDDAVRVLDGASAEAKRMASYRELSSLIARARG